MSITDDAVVFRAFCPTCGYVEVCAPQLRLAIAERSFYSFRCPGCQRNVRKPASERIVELLTNGGVPSVSITGTTSLREERGSPSGTP